MGSLDIYVTCFSDGVNRVPGLGLCVWAYVVGRALLCLLLGLLLYPLSNLAFRLASEPTHVWFWIPSIINMVFFLGFYKLIAAILKS